MCLRRVSMLFILATLFGCTQKVNNAFNDEELNTLKGGLLTTRIQSYEELKTIIQIEHLSEGSEKVRLSHSSYGHSVSSELEEGVSEKYFIQAKNGTLWDRICLGFRSPYAVINRSDLRKIMNMGRRRYFDFGEGDVAFYDIAVAMVGNISKFDLAITPPKDLSEKGYLNTFNHIAAQAFMTTLFTEEMADFVADVHERDRMVELITGRFTQEQLDDLNNGPVDNYVDIINNEWGQELGKLLKQKYSINSTTEWNAEFLANYLNEIQSYFSRVFQIGFEPFRPMDNIVKRFANKIERL